MERASNGHHPPRRGGTQLLAVHSFRGGSGKTNLAANLAFLAAREGAKVAVLDVDFQAPSLHTLLGVGVKQVLHSLSEFVQGRCEILEVPIDLTRDLGLDGGSGKLYFLPASSDLETVTSILFEGYDVPRFNEALLGLGKELELDLVVLDTHLGLNRETILSLAICDTVLVLMRPDHQDHQAAGTVVEIATRVGVPSLRFIPTMIPGRRKLAEACANEVEEYGVPVAGVLPWSNEVLEFGSQGIFAAHHPHHPYTRELERIARVVLPEPARAGGER